MNSAIILSIIGIVVIVVVVLLAEYIRIYKARPNSEKNIIYTFGGDPMEQNGKIKLSCPVGKKINVIDAWHEVYDPYAQLHGKSNTIGLYGTNSKGQVTESIKEDGTAPSDLDEKIWGVSNTSPLKNNNGNAIYNKMYTFSNIEGTKGSGSANCRIQNALSLASKIANGKENATLDLTLFASPCSGSMPSDGDSSKSLEIHQDDGSYYGKSRTLFPIGSPTKTLDKSDKPTQINGQQGYYLHGIYTCS